MNKARATATATTVAMSVIALLTAAVAVIFAVAAPPAEAAPKTISGFIGGASIGDAGAPGGLFGSLRDVAVYTANDSDPANDKIFVVEGSETGNSRVQRLDAHGNFELMWGRDVVSTGAPGDTGTGFEVCSQAVGGSTSCKEGRRGSAEGEFANPHGLAVDQSTGHVFVSDRYNLRVQEFDLDGGFVRAWGWGVATGAEGFEVCTGGCRQGLEGVGDGQFTSLEDPSGQSSDPFPGTGITVDPVNGDVFVADPANSRVQQFTSTGGFVATFGVLDDDFSFGVGEFGFGEPLRLAVDSNHIVYISDSNDQNRVQRYDAGADAFLDPIAGEPTPGAPLVEGTTVGLEIDPDGDGGGPDEEHLLVGRDRFDGDTVVQELDIPTPPNDPVTVVVDTHVYETDPSSPSVDSDQVVNGIGLSPTTGNLFLATPSLITPTSNGVFTGCSATSHCSGLIVLNSDSVALGVSGVTASATATSISVDAVANSGGGVSSYRFELSTDGASWQDSGAGGYVSGLDDQPVTGELAGLEPNTFYRVRLVVRKQTGFTTETSLVSNELVVLTDAAAPGVQTLGSSQRTERSVRLRARVDPNGAQTFYRFEYGPDGGSFDQHVPIPDASAGSGNSSDLVVADVDGLQPQTRYHYRIVATNFVGTTVGDVVVFATEAAAPPLPPRGRAYELVSPADKIAGVGVGGWYSGPGQIGFVGVPAYGGERFAAQGLAGSVLMDGAYAYGDDWALAERTPDGWTNRAVSSRSAYGSQNFALMGMNAATEDLSLTSYNSNGHVLKLFPEMEPWNGNDIGEVMMVRGWASGSWELFGPLDPDQKFSDGGTSIGSSEQEFAADGSAMVSSSTGVRGLAGPGDPTGPAFSDLESGGSVYLDEVTGPFSDVFPGDDGVRELVNVCTDGTVLPARLDAGSGTFTQGALPCAEKLANRDARLTSSRGASIESSVGEDAEGAVSADGSRVFFMSPDPRAGGTAPCEGTDVDSVCPTQLFVRQRDLEGNIVTRWISRTEVTEANGAVADQDASLMASVLFEGASRDGDKVFFRTRSPLTVDDPNGAGVAPAGGVITGEPAPRSWDLYMYDLPDGPDGSPSTPDGDPAGGDLVRISAGPDGDGDCNSALSGSPALRFGSADASRAYFACAAPLPGVLTPDDGTITSSGGSVGDAAATNLYAYDAALALPQRWRFVARLPRTSVLGGCATTAGGRGSVIGGTGGGDVVLTDDFNCMRGTADGSLLTFFTDGQLTADDPDAVSGDVYAYDAISDELTRLSAPQGGVGGTYPCATHSAGGGTLPSPPPCYGDPGIEGAAGSSLHRLGVATRPDGTRLAFFESRSRLVPEDTDEAYDVYQWSDGQLSLLSTGDGDDPDGVFYAGNDRSGRNVYLATRERLTWQDKDAVLDVYTARIDGGIPEPPSPASCDLAADECQGPAIGVPTSTKTKTDKPGGDGNASPGARKKLTIAGLSKKARRKAARTGNLVVSVRTSKGGKVSAVAKGRVGKRTQRVARKSVQVRMAGTARLRLRLNRAARQRLKSGRNLNLSIKVTSPGARSRSMSVRLPGASS